MITTAWRIILKGSSIRKVENHCFRRSDEGKGRGLCWHVDRVTWNAHSCQVGSWHSKSCLSTAGPAAVNPSEERLWQPELKMAQFGRAYKEARSTWVTLQGWWAEGHTRSLGAHETPCRGYGHLGIRRSDMCEAVYVTINPWVPHRWFPSQRHQTSPQAACRLSTL